MPDPPQPPAPSSHTIIEEDGERGRTLSTRLQGDDDRTKHLEKTPNNTPTTKKLDTPQTRTQNHEPLRGGELKGMRRHRHNREPRQRQHHGPTTTTQEQDG